MADQNPRSIAESRSSVVRLMVPTDANFAGNVFGGAILADIDRVAYVTATRHARANCVTASFDRVDFLRPVHVGQVVEYDARLTFVGHSSMEVAIEARAESLTGERPYPVVHAWVTMVAVDRDGRPTAVPPLEVTTEDDRAEFERGRARMAARRTARSALSAPSSVPVAAPASRSAPPPRRSKHAV
ncbi:MAG TPA: acyl-CoA thioesterase [Thermoplasmata archaeon]|nr:acyl-CoA thioesterase [Thermoplasmata archaeon]